MQIIAQKWQKSVNWLKNTAESVIDQVHIRVQDTINDEEALYYKNFSKFIKKFRFIAQLDSAGKVYVDQEILAPIDEHLEVPIKATIRLDTKINTTVQVKLNINLNEQDIGFNNLSLDLDDQVEIDDQVTISVEQLLDSLVDLDQIWVERLKKALPFNKSFKLQIKQPVRIKGRLSPKIGPLNIKLSKDLELNVTVPINQEIEVQGKAAVHIAKNIKVPITASVPMILDPLNFKILGVKIL